MTTAVHKLNCICSKCTNKLSVELTDNDAELLIYEDSRHRGHRKSIIVPRELGVIVSEYITKTAVSSLTPLAQDVSNLCRCSPSIPTNTGCQCTACGRQRL